MRNSLDGEIGGFIALIPVFTTGLIGLLLPPERGPLLLFSFCCLFLAKGLTDNLVSCLCR
jgi:hypothetical protein